VRRAAIPLRFALADNARQGAAIPGGLALVPAKDVGELSIVARYPSPPTIAGVVVRSLGLAPLVPQAIARRLFSPSPDYVLVRAPAH
jgi:hypothetical protein